MRRGDLTATRHFWVVVEREKGRNERAASTLTRCKTTCVAQLASSTVRKPHHQQATTLYQLQVALRGNVTLPSALNSVAPTSAEGSRHPSIPHLHLRTPRLLPLRFLA